MESWSIQRFRDQCWYFSSQSIDRIRDMHRVDVDIANPDGRAHSKNDKYSLSAALANPLTSILQPEIWQNNKVGKKKIRTCGSSADGRNVFLEAVRKRLVARFARRYSLRIKRIKNQFLSIKWHQTEWGGSYGGGHVRIRKIHFGRIARRGHWHTNHIHMIWYDDSVEHFSTRLKYNTLGVRIYLTAWRVHLLPNIYYYLFRRRVILTACH